MTTYQVAYSVASKVATVQNKGDALPANTVKIGEFKHYENAANDPLGNSIVDGIQDNHVIFHHVRDLLYMAGEQNMQAVRIDLDTTYVALASFTVVPPTVTRAVAQTQQITHVFTPGGASNQKVTYVSSDPTKATVSASGLITAVATGSATITATTEDGGFTGTCVVTVS